MLEICVLESFNFSLSYSHSVPSLLCYLRLVTGLGQCPKMPFRSMRMEGGIFEFHYPIQKA